MKNAFILHAQGDDVSSLIDKVAATPVSKSLRMKRYRNSIIGDTIPAVETILADFQSFNPLSKSLAIKRAGLIVTAETADVLVPIIKEGAFHEDPYVRKSSALAIMKLDINDTTLIELYKLDQTLKALIEDSNINVVANAGTALVEINKGRVKPLFRPSVLCFNNMISAIADASEWVRVQILELVSSYDPHNEQEALSTLERITPYLSNSNATVTFAIVRCTLRMITFIKDKAQICNALQNLLQPIIKLMNSGPEMQLVVLRSYLVLLQKFNRPLANVSVFFVKEEDAEYVVTTKLDVIKQLTTKENINDVMPELMKYSNFENSVISRKSIAELGRLALTFQEAADRCVECFTDLIQNGDLPIKQECIVASVNILRQYPFKYPELIQTIFDETQDGVDDPQAKAALIWILGEYCLSIDVTDTLVGVFVPDFLEEPTDVQLALITAVTKFFMAFPEKGLDALEMVMTLATTEVADPDVRDRAFMYLKLMANHPQHSVAIVPSSPQEDPNTVIPIQTSTTLSKRLIDSLVGCIASIACTMYRFPDEFQPATGNEISPNVILPLLLDRSQRSYDTEIRGQFMVSDKDERTLVLQIKNMANESLMIDQIILDYNMFGLTPKHFADFSEIQRKKSAHVVIPLMSKPAFIDLSSPSNLIGIEMKVNRNSPIKFGCPLALPFILVEDGRMDQSTFKREWQSVPKEKELVFAASDPTIHSLEEAKSALGESHIFIFATKNAVGYFSGRTVTGDWFILLASFANEARFVLRMQNEAVAPLILALLTQAIS